MRGITHLALGLTTGVAVAAWLPVVPFTLSGVAVAGVSALAPDLDHPESRISKRISLHTTYLKVLIGAAAVGLAVWSYLHTAGEKQTLLLEVAGAGLLVGLFIREATARRFTLLFTALMLGAAGIYFGAHWLGLLGLFVGVSPFTAHRSWTHTLWAVLFWYYLAREAERDLELPGLAWQASAGYVSHLLGDTLTRRGVRWLFPLWEKALVLPLIRTGSKAGNFWEAVICAVYLILVITFYR
ncbi:MAG: metal-dependent hydrolase [Catalinimonas sp.]